MENSIMEWFKNVLSATGTKSPFTSMGVIGGAVSIVSMVVALVYGASAISAVDQGTLVEQGKVLWDASVAWWAAATAFGGTVMAIWGRLRAMKSVFGSLLK